uniref:Uncharacterized protein n=1 Tax=Anguilla anguilla TaxID=7936 RepID=A0A0E9SQX2_ANGAN
MEVNYYCILNATECGYRNELNQFFFS